jgi:long-subunit acyl-CoA synthetase (AMP-forming)
MNPIEAALENRVPDDIVLVDSVAALTAGQLLTHIDELRSMLARAGIDRLGLLAGNSAAWVAADLACQFADICLLPMPVFFADAQLRHSMQSAGINAVLTDDPQRVTAVAGIDRAPNDCGSWQGLTLLRFPNGPRSELPAGTQKITFTSGSTGTPRGVCLSVKQQLCVADALAKALQFQAPRHLCLLPLSTLLENVSGVYYPLLAGGTVVTPTDTDTGFSGSTGLDMLSMLRAFSRHQPTSIILLPQMLVGLVAALETGWKAPAELRFAAVGGAKVSPELIRCARDFGLPVYEGYGLSETASVACLNHPGKDLPGSVGSPLSHVQVGVEDGEIIIAGNTFLGYLNEPASWGKSQVATGDLGEQDAEGFVHLFGRRKNLLISSFGRNISPEWVESELLLYPEIAQCVVVGDARPYCTALIAAASPAIDNQRIGSLLKIVNQGLPDYARIQRWHRLREMLRHADGLFTENGRPRRMAIAEHFAATIDSMYDDSDTDCSANTSNVEPLRAVSL